MNKYLRVPHPEGQPPCLGCALRSLDCHGCNIDDGEHFVINPDYKTPSQRVMELTSSLLLNGDIQFSVRSKFFDLADELKKEEN